MFPGPTGGPMSPDSVLHMLHRVLKRAGLPRVRFHDLRHAFATLALQNGVDVKTVSGMLGHYSAGFTLDTYAHVTTSAQRQAAEAMEHVPLRQFIALSSPEKFPYGSESGADSETQNKPREKVAGNKNNPLESGDSSGFLVAGGGLEPPTSGL